MSFYQDRYIKFNDRTSDGFFFIVDKKEELLSKSIDTQEIPNSYGSKLESIKYNSKKIILNILFTMEQLQEAKITSIHDLKRSIAYFFDSDTPQKFWDSKDPNVYCNVLFNGTSEIEFLGNKTATTEIELLILDGLHYSVVEKEFSAYTNSEDVLEALIESDGTAESVVSYEMKMNHDNGYVGIVSEYGVMEFGKRDEVDGVIAEKSTVLTSNKSGDFANWSDGNIFYENQNKKKVTTMTSDTKYGGRLGIMPQNYTNPSNYSCFGAIKEKAFTESSEHFYLWAQAWFETGLMGQTGCWTLAILDENNYILAGMALEKVDKVGNSATCRFLVGVGNGGSRVINTIVFTPSFWEKDNPYGSESRGANRNPFDIRKEGGSIRFFWRGKYYTYLLPELANRKAKTLQFFVGQYKGQNTTKQQVTHMYINNLAFTRLKEPYWKDTPNRYAPDDVLRMDGQTKTPYVNELPRYSDQLKGTEYFTIPKGKTKINFYFSDFNKPDPEIKVYLKEAFI
ncbi:phage tail domain-containing protein [Enterococcus sp. LJL99]